MGPTICVIDLGESSSKSRFFKRMIQILAYIVHAVYLFQGRSFEMNPCQLMSCREANITLYALLQCLHLLDIVPHIKAFQYLKTGSTLNGPFIDQIKRVIRISNHLHHSELSYVSGYSASLLSFLVVAA